MKKTLHTQPMKKHTSDASRTVKKSTDGKKIPANGFSGSAPLSPRKRSPKTVAEVAAKPLKKPVVEKSAFYEQARKYTVSVNFNEEKGEFIATCPSWPYLSGVEKSVVSAYSVLIEAIELSLESAAEYEMPVPSPDPILVRVRQLRKIIKTAQLAKLAGINENTLRTKLRRDTPFTEEEGSALRQAFEKIGVGV